MRSMRRLLAKPWSFWLRRGCAGFVVAEDNFRVFAMDEIEFLAQVEVFGITFDEVECGMLLTRALDHGVADLDADAVSQVDGSKKLPGLAAHGEDALLGRDDEAQEVLDAVVEITIRANPFGTVGATAS